MALQAVLMGAAPLLPFMDRMPGLPSTSGALVREKEKAPESGAVGRLDEIPLLSHYSCRLSGSVFLGLELHLENANSRNLCLFKVTSEWGNSYTNTSHKIMLLGYSPPVSSCL